MLQYKLKHLCSRIIAGLSAFGLFNIASDANAVEYKPGASFTYNFTSDQTFTATYEATNDICVFSADKNIISGKYTSGTTGASGQTGFCTFTCKDGYGLSSDGSSGYTTSVSGADGTIVAQTGCVELKPNCIVPDAASGLHISYASTGTKDNKFYCIWHCEDGYSVGGGTSTGTGITSITGFGDMYPTEGCSARTFKVTFDCLAGGKYGSSSGQSGTATATYGQSFTIPTDATCKKTGYNFSGWYSGATYTKQ